MRDFDIIEFVVFIVIGVTIIVSTYPIYFIAYAIKFRPTDLKLILKRSLDITIESFQDFMYLNVFTLFITLGLSFLYFVVSSILALLGIFPFRFLNFEILPLIIYYEVVCLVGTVGVTVNRMKRSES